MIDAGADLLFGYSGYVAWGVEIYQKKPILYCTGNFLDDYAVDNIERNDRSCLFLAEYIGTRLATLCLYPTVMQTFRAMLARFQERKAMETTMQQRYADLHTPTTWNEQQECLEISLT